MTNAILRSMQNDREWPWEEKAREDLNENAQTNEQNLSALKDKINDYSKTHPKFRPQLDDELLMAYLRTCKFNVRQAMARYKKFNKVRLCNPEKIFPVGKGPKDFMRYYTKPIVCLLKQRNPSDGTIVLVYSFRNFDPNEDVIEDVLNAVFLMLMEIVVDPSVQAYGVRIIVDFTGMSFAIFKSAMGKMYYNKAAKMVQESCPMLIKGIHAINAPAWIVTVVYVFFRPLFPKELRDSLRFHRSVNEIHQFISTSILPDIFGGAAGPWEGMWMKEAIEEIHDDVVEKSYFGFIEP